MIKQVQAFGSVLLGMVVAGFGGVDNLLTVFLIVVFTDFLTGVLKSLQQGQYKSSEFRNGLFRKIAYFIAIILVVQLDTITNSGGMFRGILIMFLITNEMASIVENLGVMGVPFPSQITQAIEVLKDKNKHDNKDNI